MFSRRPPFLLLAALALFIAPAAAGLVSIPPYYEDESWVYLAPFEALRGNGFTWAAFHEGAAMLGTFNALVFGFLKVSPFGPEITVRAISLLFGLLCLAGVLVLGRRLGLANPETAVVLLVFTQVWFLYVRYGRTDVVALAFAVWALAAAASRPFWAGVLSGIAVGIHPIFVWLAPVCTILTLPRAGWRSLTLYCAGGIAGIAPQAVWVFLHFSDIKAISVRYFITTSAASGLRGLTSSLFNEPQRYSAYAAQLGPVEALAVAAIYLGLPIVALARSQWRERIVWAGLILFPLVTLALLVRGKNPMYLIYVLPCLAVVAAAGLQKMRAAVIHTVCAAALLWSAVRYAQGAQEMLRMPQADRFVEEIARRLPPNATVFSPLTYAGLVKRRPDLQFFTYHALSLREGWRLPACESIPGTLRSLADNDPRATSRPLHGHVDTVFFVKWPDQELLAYLRSIYTEATAADMACLFGSGTPDPVRICGAGRDNCREVEIVRRPLP